MITFLGLKKHTNKLCFIYAGLLKKQGLIES